MSVVTGACMAMIAGIFFDLGNFDENFAIAGDDELCIRSTKAGLRNIYEPKIRVMHKESVTRKRGLPGEEVK